MIEGDVTQWKSSSINALSAAPIQLAVPDRTPYILLSEPSHAIVIPSEILSPLPSPAASCMEESDYFCTSPGSTCSSDIFSYSIQQDSPLTALDAANILEDFDSSFATFINEEKPSSDNNDMTYSSLFSNEVLNHLDTSLLENLLLDSDLFLTTNPILLSS